MKHASVHDVFSKVAAERRNQIAIDRVTRQISYGDLETRSNQLANSLLAGGFARGSLAGILVRDPIEVVISILGVMKAGGVFVPLDPGFPLSRLEAMAAQVQARCFVVEPQFADSAGHLLGEGVQDLVVRFELLERDGEEPCSIYFTSGSTGRPKAILGRLKGIDHFIRWELETLGLGASTRVSQLASPSFDPFLRDVFVGLCAGGTVCAPQERSVVLEAARLRKWLGAAEVEVVHCVPSVLRALLNEGLEAEDFPRLKWVLLAGEAVLPADVKRWTEVFGERIQLVNLYGPTETTMTKLYYFITAADAERPSIPIGKPMPGAAAMVLNSSAKPCPPGVAGEIYIRTPYRSLGYYGELELTRQVFVQNPFTKDPDDLVYKTGDQGRLLKDGNLEFLGRKDHQVKVRGVRVELAEVENLLRGFAGVKDVAVVDREDSTGTKFLCAYVVLGEAAESGKLREYVAAQLPEYMVPSAFLEMAELPRTFNGKIDRKALPTLQESRARKVGNDHLPQAPVEEIVAGIWKEVLRLPSIGDQARRTA